MKNKKMFNLGLYAEGIKQLKLIGILSLAVMMFEAILIPVEQVISMTRVQNFDMNNVIAKSVNVMDAHPILLLTFIIVAPLMALSLFSFMNKRNASDFYHSLPHTRFCIYMSYAASIVTWIALLILSTSAVSIILHLIFNKFFTLILSSYIKLMIGCFAASLLVVFSVITAMTITGTTFTNVIVSGLIIFLPRFIIMMVTVAVTDQLPIVSQNHLSQLLSIDINIVTGVIFGQICLGTIPTSVLTSAYSQIYTVILAVFYFIFAALLFCRRKSESAERSAPNRIMQAVYRITVTMVFCTFVCCLIFMDRKEDPDIFMYIVLYMIAVLIYLTYELITTKRWKCVMKSLPGLAVVALLNVALFGSIYGIYKTNLNFKPTADEIESVSIVQDYTPGYYYELGISEFLQMKDEEVEITDREIVEMVASSLEKCVEEIEERGGSDYYSHYYRYSEYTFKINLDGSSKYRTIYIPLEYDVKIAEALEKNDAFKENWTTLPEPVKNTVTFSSESLNPQYADKIFRIMEKEIKKVDFDKWYTYFKSSSADYSFVDAFEYSTIYGGKSWDIYVPIFPELFPETCTEYFKCIYENSSKSIDYVKDYLTTNEFLESGGFTANIVKYNEEIQKYETYYMNVSSEQLKEAGKYLADCISDEPASVGKSYVSIQIWNEDDFTSIYVITAVSDDMLQKMPVYFENMSAGYVSD